MELAAQAEIPIIEFWQLTPREISVVAQAYAQRLERRQKENIYQAYLISRWVWAKKIDIQKYLGDKKPKRRMTDEQMLAQVKALNAIFGGEVVKRQLCETE